MKLSKITLQIFYSDKAASKFLPKENQFCCYFTLSKIVSAASGLPDVLTFSKCFLAFLLCLCVNLKCPGIPIVNKLVLVTPFSKYDCMPLCWLHKNEQVIVPALIEVEEMTLEFFGKELNVHIWAIY